MLKLTSTQMAQIGAAKRHGFYARLHRELRDFLAETCPDVSADMADDRIARAFQTCLDHGFATEKQITRLSYILVTFPAEYPAMARYRWLVDLVRAGGTPETRLDRITAVIRRAERAKRPVS